jgi:glycosyltransferase involved in cell wall biosynthesis
LAPSKRYDHAIIAVAALAERLPHASLTIVGDGRERQRLEALAREMGVADRVRLLGRLSEQEKLDAIDAADILVGTSVREGWGLTVNEAAARGLPAVVYDIPGFRDAVVDGRTGLLVEPDPHALAAAVERLLREPQVYERLRRNAWSAAGSVTYDQTADAFEGALLDVTRPQG